MIDLKRLALTVPWQADGLYQLFQVAALESGWLFCGSETWETTETDLSLAGPLVAYHRERWGTYAVTRDKDGSTYLSLGKDGQLTVYCSAKTMRQVDERIAALRVAFPRAPRSDGQVIPLWLWTMTDRGPQKIRRMIDTPDWSEIAPNYPLAVRDSLASLMDHRPQEGKIILWHGPPGTGKTWALRALGFEWRSWCDLHYVVDPEVMFGKDSSYLVRLLLDSAETAEIGPASTNPDERWRLVILEDTGEMLEIDAREHIGQSLSRLLNVTDGLIGQGLRVMVLVTTNEEIARLHPAVSRPGRCAANIAFSALPSAEAAEWLKQHQAVAGTTKARTLAELYGVLRGDSEPEEARIGLIPRRVG